MNNKLMVIMLSVACAMPVFAADAMNKTSPPIQPGRYVSSILPAINKEMSDRVQDSVGKVPGLEKVDGKHGDSTLHFTVKDGSKVAVTDIQKAVAKVDPDAVMSEPVLEKSMNLHPGF
jgi:hypothetical protein